MCHVTNHVDKGAINPSLAKNMLSVCSCRETQHNTTQRGTEREGERERERERETGLTSNECSYSPCQSTTLPSSPSLFSVNPFPIHIVIPFSHLALPKKRERKKKQNKGLLPFFAFHFYFTSICLLPLFLLQFIFF